MGIVSEFCMNCCFWIQVIGIGFFAVMMMMVIMDNYYMVALTPTHKRDSLLTLALAAVVSPFLHALIG